MSRFHVRDTFSIDDKRAFVLAGFAIEGEITAGMLVSMPFNAKVTMTAKIDHIELVRRPDGDVVCICIRCAAPEEVALWQALKIKDSTVEIIPSA